MNRSIKKILTLICREYWEHKILMIWFPFGVTLLVLLLQLGAATMNLDSSVSYTSSSQQTTGNHTQSEEVHLTGMSALTYLLFKQTPTADPLQKFDHSLQAFTGFLGLMLFLALLIYAHSCFYADRQRKEILFWHSLPVSETQNLISKLLVICVAMPAIYALMLLPYGLGNMLCLLEGEAMLIVVLRVTQLTIASILFSVIFLPVISWILFCSAAARRSPIFLSTIMPFALGLILSLALGKNYITWVVRRYFSAMSDKVKLGPEILRQQVEFLASSEFLIGLLVSAVLLAACVWLRNNRYEI